MIKKTLLAMVSCIICMNVFAQKEMITVKAFTKNGEVSDADLNSVRAAVIASLAKSTRFKIIDEASASTVKDEAIAANFIIEGNVSQCAISREKTDDGGFLYTCALQYSVTAIDAQSSEVLLTESYTHPKNIGESVLMAESTPQDATLTSIKKVSGDIAKFINNAFPVSGTIFGEDFEVSGDKLKSCWIDLGTMHGIRKGDRFKIYEVVTRVGRKVENEIGTLTVEEPSEDVSKCKVKNSDQKDVKAAMDRYIENTSKDSNAAKLRVKITNEKGLGGKLLDTVK